MAGAAQGMVCSCARCGGTSRRHTGRSQPKLTSYKRRSSSFDDFLTQIQFRGGLVTAKQQKGLPMSKSTRNTGKSWTAGNVRELRKLANENTPTRVIGLKLGRTEEAVRTKASEEGVSLKPTNQSPYNRR